ncbi:Fanconi anemia group M protein [Vespula squamosa]|uniref:Fanconi anemia group M protein n=1 Tax=Vespula squamosa TaxID=30214 RepID=A0ABD2BR39_VESSQ
MFRFLLISTLIGFGLANLVVKRNNDFQSTEEPQEQLQQSTVTQNQIDNHLQTYSYLQGNKLSPLVFHYPSYPEYLKNEDPIQSRLEEYQVSITASPQEKHEWSSGFATSLIPLATSIMVYGTQFGTYLVYFLLALAVGGAITILVCTFSSICTNSILDLSLYNSQMKEQVADLARAYITPESLNAATVYILRAYNKYNAMQQEKRGKSK